MMSKLIGENEGFTLLELMVVMALLTVLMGMTFTAVTGAKATAVESTALADANTAQKAIDRFISQSAAGGPGQAADTSPSQSLNHRVFPEAATIATVYTNGGGTVQGQERPRQDRGRYCPQRDQVGRFGQGLAKRRQR